MDDPAIRSNRAAWLRRALAAVGLGLAALATRHGAGPWLDPAVAGLTGLGLAAIAFLLYWTPFGTGGATDPSAPAANRRPLEPLLLGLLLAYAVSSAVTDNWFFPSGWKMPLEAGAGWLDRGAVRCVLAALALAVVFRPFLRTWRGLALAWVFLAGLAVHHLYSATGFGMIYRVDSPAFVYRFWTFQHLERGQSYNL